MLLPLGTDRRLSRPPVITISLIALNLAVFVLCSLPGLAGPVGLPGVGPADGQTGMDPTVDRVLAALVLWRDNFHWWSLLSYAFLHQGFWHILGNMLVLWVFGPGVEDRLGKVGYVLLYLCGAAAAGGLHLAFDRSPVIGASGAVAAVTGAFLVLMPRVQIKCLLLVVMIGVFEIPAWWFIAFAIAKDFAAIGTGTAGNVAVMAHAGGYVFGFVVSMALVGLKLVPRERFDLVGMFVADQRLREIKSATRGVTDGAASQPPERVRAKLDELPNPADIRTLEQRAALMTHIEEGRWAEAAALHGQIISDRGLEHPLSTLPRDKQLQLANGLLEAGIAEPAARAYRQFVTANPRDRELGSIKVMLGLVLWRYLGDTAAAKAAVEGVSDVGLNPDAAAILGQLRSA